MADGLKSDHYGEIKVKWTSVLFFLITIKACAKNLTIITLEYFDIRFTFNEFQNGWIFLINLIQMRLEILQKCWKV